MTPMNDPNFRLRWTIGDMAIRLAVAEAERDALIEEKNVAKVQTDDKPSEPAPSE